MDSCVEWDICDVLDNNTSVFIVKNLPDEKLLFAMSVVFHYINQYNIEDDAAYDLLFYAEPVNKSETNEYMIFTSLPYDRFLIEEPEFLLEL